MEEVNKSRKGRITVYVIAGALAAFLIYYAVISVLGPVRKMELIVNAYGPVAKENEKINENIYTDSAYISLLKEKAYVQAKTLMAQTDSIYLAINLVDSTAAIEISGVTVHSARISSYNISSILRNSDRNSIYNMLSQPLSVENAISTIKKEPVMIKIAPKDTSEYQPDVIPDTSIVEHVNCILEVSNGLRIYVYQEELDKPAEKGSTFRFDLRDRLNTAWSSLKSAALFRVPEYHPYIKIRIPRDDVKIIYRALPRNGQIAVYT